MCDDGVDPVASEKIVGKEKLGIEELIFGVLIDDRDAAQLTHWSLRAPLCPEHGKHPIIEPGR